MLLSCFFAPRKAVRKPTARRCQIETLEDRLVLAWNFQSAPIIPAIDAAMQSHLQSVYRLGQSLGEQANVFSKIGDSNSYNTNFLDPLGAPNYASDKWANLGTYTSLENTLAYFREQPVDSDDANSLAHASVATYGGWTSTDLLTPGQRGVNSGLPVDAALSPLQAEIQETRPAIALVMIGTCEVGSDDTQLYEENLTTITRYLLSQGVIPVLSTIPDIKLNPDPSLAVMVDEYNQIIADVAAANNVPLWNLSVALNSLPNQGIGSDEVHLSISPDGSGDFSSKDLSYGMNVRNLTALQVLNKLVTIVEQDDRPDPTPAPNTSVPAAPFLTAIYRSVLQRKIDPAGQAAFTQQISQGYSIGEVVQEIWASPEHRALEIEGYYQQFFHRPADAAGMEYWQIQFTLGLSETAVEAGFAATAEYHDDHPNNTAVVAGLYEDLLRRGPSANEDAAWADQLGAGQSVLTVATEIAQSQEAYQQVIGQYYLAFLGRVPDPASWQYALGLLQDPFTGFLPLAELLLTSKEYLEKM